MSKEKQENNASKPVNHNAGSGKNPAKYEKGEAPTARPSK